MKLIQVTDELADQVRQLQKRTLVWTYVLLDTKPVILTPLSLHIQIRKYYSGTFLKCVLSDR